MFSIDIFIAIAWNAKLKVSRASISESGRNRMEIPFTTMGHFIAVIFVSVRCIVVLLLTLGREHTGENTFVVMLRSMTNFHISNANTLGCVCVWTNIDGPRYFDFTNL